MCTILRSKFYYKYLRHFALLLWRITKQDQVFEFQIITFFNQILKGKTLWRSLQSKYYFIIILSVKLGVGGSLRSLH